MRDYVVYWKNTRMGFRFHFTHFHNTSSFVGDWNQLPNESEWMVPNSPGDWRTD